MNIENKFLKVYMLDGSKWKIPVRIIAEHKARYYANKTKDSFESKLKMTFITFKEDEFEIEDWASNNMDWTDVEKYAIQIKNSQMSLEEFQESWVNGAKEIIEE